MAVWQYGSMAVWRYGGMAVWRWGGGMSGGLIEIGDTGATNRNVGDLRMSQEGAVSKECAIVALSCEVVSSS